MGGGRRAALRRAAFAIRIRTEGVQDIETQGAAARPGESLWRPRRRAAGALTLHPCHPSGPTHDCGDAELPLHDVLPLAARWCWLFPLADLQTRCAHAWAVLAQERSRRAHKRTEAHSVLLTSARASSYAQDLSSALPHGQP